MKEVTQYYCPNCDDPKIVHYPSGSVLAFSIFSRPASHVRNTNMSYSCHICGYTTNFETLEIQRGQVFIKERDNSEKKC